jgi:hypothetical protein
LIIAGGRDITQYGFVEATINFLGIADKITEVCCGMANGVDTSGLRWANEHKIPVKVFEADWNKHGKAAGPIRNEQMAQYADALLLIWDGESKGSKSMLGLAEKYNLVIHEVTIKKG